MTILQWDLRLTIQSNHINIYIYIYRIQGASAESLPLPPKKVEKAKPIIPKKDPNALKKAVKGGLPVSTSSMKNHYKCNNRNKFDLEGRYYEGWCAEKDQKGEYVQIDGKEVVEWKKIETRGNKPRFVTFYDIQQSDDGKTWNTAKEGIKGNTEPYSIIPNVLDPPIRARMIRIVPQSWSTAGLGMKLEAYYKK